MNRPYVTAVFALLMALLASCSGNDNADDEGAVDALMEQRVMQLENANTYGASARYEQLESLSAAFQQSIEDFHTKASVDRLEAARERWKLLARALKKCELYDIGGVKDSYLHYRIHRWPVNIDLLNDSLEGTTVIDAVYANRLGSQIIGLGAIEYLLFEQDVENTHQRFSDEPRRLTYLLEVTRLQHKLMTEAKGEWSEYGPEFIVATQSRISGGQNQLTNSLLSFLEQTARLRLGNPAGQSLGQEPDVSKLEAPFSDYSLEMIASGFEEWKHCFYGDFPGSENKYGFDDYLEQLDAQDLTDRIRKAVEACEAEIANTKALNNELLNNTQQVMALQERLKELSILIKADLASAIGATITVNDSDGDS